MCVFFKYFRNLVEILNQSNRYNEGNGRGGGVRSIIRRDVFVPISHISYKHETY